MNDLDFRNIVIDQKSYKNVFLHNVRCKIPDSTKPLLLFLK